MKPDFSRVSEAGRAHIKHLAKPIPIDTGEVNTDRLPQINGTRCVVRTMEPKSDTRIHHEPENSDKKVNQGS